MAVPDVLMTLKMEDDDPFIQQKLDYIEGSSNPFKLNVRKDLNANSQFLAYLRLACYRDANFDL